MIKLPIPILLTALMLPLMADDIVVKEIGGVPIIRTKIHYGDKEIEASILFDIGSNTPMVIHEKCLGGLDLHPMAAEGQEVDIEFSGNFRWKGVPLHVEKRLPLIETLTRDFARELDEVPVVAIVGLPAIKSNVVELDLRKGLLRTLGLASGENQAKELDYEAKPYGIVLQGIGPTGAPAKVQMNLSGEDSMLDMSLLDAARKAGKTPNFLEIGGIKFSDQTAFRFEWPDPAAPEHIDAVIGLSAVRNFIVTMWPKRGKIAFAPHPPVPFPQATQDYFFALADKKPDAVLEFISKSPPGRLRDDACLALWKMRIDDEASKVFFHHFVARQALTPPDGIDLKTALTKPFAFAVDAEKMRENQSWSMSGLPMGFSDDVKKTRENLTELLNSSGRSKPSYVDPNKLLVMVFVQQQDNRRVLEAKSFSLPQKEEQL